MKNLDVIILKNSGFLSFTTNSIDASQSYKVFKFKKEIKSLFDSIGESERELIKECDLTLDEDGQLKGSEENLAKFRSLQQEMFNEEITIEAKTIPYDQWHSFVRENKDAIDAETINYLEVVLENILWKAPEED